MSEFRLKAVELATSLGHKAVDDLLASAHAIEAFISGEVTKVETAVKAATSKKATPATVVKTETAAPAAKTETAAPAADLDAIRKAMKNLITKNLRDSITETFAKYGAQDASSLKAEQYSAVLQDLQAALALA